MGREMGERFKIKRFYSEKAPVKGMKRQARDLEKIFANQISNKVLISGTYRGLSRFNNIKKKLENENFLITLIGISFSINKRCN